MSKLRRISSVDFKAQVDFAAIIEHQYMHWTPIKLVFIISVFLASCGGNNKGKLITASKADRNEILLINKAFYSELIKDNGSGEERLGKAFNNLARFEPIIFSIFRGNASRKVMHSNLNGGDFSRTCHGFDYDYFFYYMPNYQGMFQVDNPNNPHLISAKWHSSDTTFYRTSNVNTSSTIGRTCYLIQSGSDSSLYLLNGKFKMVDISSLLDRSEISVEKRNPEFFRQILNTIVLQECSDSFDNLYKPEAWWRNDFSIDRLVDDVNHSPVNYFPQNQNQVDQQIKFETKNISFISLKFFPKRADRKGLGLEKISGVYGVNQFLMDHDLTSGYVHPYTENFFNKLDQEGFVLRIRRSPIHVNQGVAYYVQKKDLSKDDILGQNIAFCRQWKLSEIAMAGNNVFMKRCGFSKSCTCLQVKSSSVNPYNAEIPIWSTNQLEGYIPLDNLDEFGDRNGGSAAIIWKSERHGIVFKDIHGSIKDILTTALEIRDRYNTDPVIGVYDAGTYGRKFKSNNGILDFNLVDRNTSNGRFVGAGFGYLID